MVTLAGPESATCSDPGELYSLELQRRHDPFLAAEILRLENEIHRWSGYLDFLEINIPHIRVDPKMGRYFLWICGPFMRRTQQHLGSCLCTGRINQ